jgi:hypothetical protein
VIVAVTVATTSHRFAVPPGAGELLPGDVLMLVKLKPE